MAAPVERIIPNVVCSDDALRRVDGRAFHGGRTTKNLANFKYVQNDRDRHFYSVFVPNPFQFYGRAQGAPRRLAPGTYLVNILVDLHYLWRHVHRLLLLGGIPLTHGIAPKNQAPAPEEPE